MSIEFANALGISLVALASLGVIALAVVLVIPVRFLSRKH